MTTDGWIECREHALARTEQQLEQVPGSYRENSYWREVAPYKSIVRAVRLKADIPIFWGAADYMEDPSSKCAKGKHETCEKNVSNCFSCIADQAPRLDSPSTGGTAAAAGSGKILTLAYAPHRCALPSAPAGASTIFFTALQMPRKPTYRCDSIPGITPGFSCTSRPRVPPGITLQHYFFSRLVWLATHSHLPSAKIQVSVKRPKCS
jgi:hypothetical protein